MLAVADDVEGVVVLPLPLPLPLAVLPLAAAAAAAACDDWLPSIRALPGFVPPDPDVSMAVCGAPATIEVVVSTPGVVPALPEGSGVIPDIVVVIVLFRLN